MADTCSPNANNVLNKQNAQLEPNFPIREDSKFSDDVSQGMFNIFNSQQKDPKIFKKGSSKVETLKNLKNYLVKDVLQIKYDVLNKSFMGYMDGKQKEFTMSYLREKILTLPSSMSATHETSINEIYDDFEVTVYDGYGNPVLDKDGNEVTEQLSQENVSMLSAYIFNEQLIEMYDDNKKVYFKDDFIDMINNPDNYGIEKEYAQHYIDSIEESVDLFEERAARIRMNEEIESSKLKFAKTNDKQVDELTDEEIKTIEQTIEDQFQLSEKEKEAVRKEARESNEVANYVSFIRNDYLPQLKSHVDNSNQMQEAYQNIMQSRENLNDTVNERYAEIGRDTSNIFKRNHYFKIILDETQKQVQQGVKNPTIFGVSFKNVVGQEGFYGKVLTNFKNAEYIYRTNMRQNLAKAELVKEFNKYNIAKDIVKDIQNTIQNINQDFNDRLLNNGKITTLEEQKLISNTHQYNNKFASKYPGTEIVFDKDNYQGKREFLDTNKNVQEGSIFQEFNNNTKIVEENIMNKLKQRVTDGELDSYFDENPDFKDIKKYLLGETETIAKERLNVFYDRVNKTTNSNHKINEALDLLNLKQLQKDMQTVILKGKAFNLNKILKPYMFDKNGEQRYVLTNDMGMELNPFEQKQIGSMWFPDFDKDNGTKFAEYMAQNFMLENSRDGALLSDLLQDNRVRIMPKPISEVMESLQHKIDDKTNNVGKLSNWLANTTSVFKVGMLFSPFQAVTYNTRNMISDTYFMMQSTPQALKQFGNGEFYRDLFNYFAGKDYSQSFDFFLKNTETFYGMSFDEIFKQLNSVEKGTLQSMKDLLAEEGILSEQEGVAAKTKVSMAKGIKLMNILFKKYLGGVTHFSQAREFVLRYATYRTINEQLMNSLSEDGTVSLKSYGSAKRKIMDNFMSEIAQEKDTAKKKVLIDHMAVTYANQTLVAYKDASEAVDYLSRFAIPFMRFAEGNVRLHARLLENFAKDFYENAKNGDFKGVAKTLGRGSYQSALALGIPTAIWNAVMLALAGMDEDDIPKYYEDNGYFVMPPVRRMFGAEGVSYISNVDVFSDMMGYLSLDSLNNNIGDALKKNFNALLDEDTDTNLVGDISEAFRESFKDWTPTQDFGQKMISMSNPMIKSPFEASLGVDIYPESSANIKGRYTFAENSLRKVLQLFGLQKLFNVGEELFGTPRGMNMLETFGFKTNGSQVDAFNMQRERAYTYAEEVLGKDLYSSNVGWGNDQALLRDDIKNSIKHGDYDRALKKFAEYDMWLIENTENDEDYQKGWVNLQNSIKSSFDVIPTSAIAQKDLQEYVNSLSQEEYQELLLAYEHQKDILGPFYEWTYGK